MSTKTIPAVLVFLSFTMQLAPAVERDGISYLTGRTRSDKEIVALMRTTLGDRGALSIRSQERWDTIKTLLLGWEPPRESFLRDVDFQKQMLVLVFKTG